MEKMLDSPGSVFDANAPDASRPDHDVRVPYGPRRSEKEAAEQPKPKRKMFKKDSK